jgi:hypothetical protein
MNAAAGMQIKSASCQMVEVMPEGDLEWPTIRYFFASWLSRVAIANPPRVNISSAFFGVTDAGTIHLSNKVGNPKN